MIGSEADAEQRPDRERVFARRRALVGRKRRLSESSLGGASRHPAMRRCRWRTARHGCRHGDRGPSAVSVRGDRRDVAVVDGFLKPALGGAALEPKRVPSGDRLMRHIGVDIDPGHQPAAESRSGEPPRSSWILFSGCLRRVEGFDPVGAERGSGHGSSSWLRAQACTAAAPPQSFRS